MANKRLTAIEIHQMKTMVANGTAPEDIANTFGMAISSVHNYKKRFKEEGLSFPNVRGKRPTGAIDVHSGEPANITHINTPHNKYKYVVNGVTVEISAQAKNVVIGKDSMEINF